MCASGRLRRTMAERTATCRRAPRRAAAVLVAIALGAGCAGVEETARSTHHTLADVSDLAARAGTTDVERLYAVEDRILRSCEEVLESVHHVVNGEEIPLLTRILALLSAGGCGHSVVDARRALRRAHDPDN